MIIALLFTSCANTTEKPTAPKLKEYYARVTYYTPDAKWGTQVSMSSSMRAKTGVTVAAHPDFKYGTKLYIPALKDVYDGDGNFVVQDRGSAVTSKKAARGKGYVFDVFVSAASHMRKFEKLKPMWMKVYVVE